MLVNATNPMPTSVTWAPLAGGTPNGVFSGITSTYQASYPFPDGVYTIVASGGGASAPITFSVDRTPPVVTIKVPLPAHVASNGVSPFDPGLGGADAWKRDEVINVGVGSNETGSASGSPSLSVRGLLRGGGFSPLITLFPGTAVANCCATGTVLCSCFQLDLATVPFESFNGMIQLTGSASDQATNNTTINQMLQVTRWRWSKSLFGPNELERSPALDTSGNIYAASSSSVVASNVASLDQTGQQRWKQPQGAAVSSAISLGQANDLCYVPVFDGGSGGIINYTTAGALFDGGCTLAAGDVRAAPAIAILGGVETVLMARQTSPSELVAHQPVGGFGCASKTIAFTTFPAMSLATVNQQLFFGNRMNDELLGEFNAGATPLAGFPVSVAGLAPHAVAISGNRIIGTANHTGTDGGVFAAGLDGGLLWVYQQPGVFGGIALGQNGRAYFGTDKGTFHQLNTTTTPPTALANLSALGPISASPLIGQGRDGGSPTVYVGTDTGVVYAFDTTDMSLIWSMPAIGQAFTSSPTADCSRDPGKVAGTRPGTIYFVGHGATAGLVVALITDSAGPDQSAPWPKFQHDVRNTGNAGTNPNDLGCPPP
jgi:outer membrane protein assembly factor BamB